MSTTGDLMEVSLTQRPPRARCFECGSLNIQAVCHHCWRPGCRQHVSPTPRWAERLLGKEGSGPGLAKAHAIHCAACDHVNRRRFALCAAGVAVMAMGVIAVWLNLITGLALIAGGGGVAAWAYHRVRRKAARARSEMPLVVYPKMESYRLTERLRAPINLGPEGDYETRPSPIEGEITAVMLFGRSDRDRLASYIRKRPHGQPADVRFTAGRLILKGHVKARDLPSYPCSFLALDGSTGALPVFRAEDPHASSAWTVSQSYELPSDPTLGGPIWITPSFVPGSARRAIELDIQWPDAKPPHKPLSLDIIDVLELRFPGTWGEVQHVSGRAIQGTSGQEWDGPAQRFVKWRHLLPTWEQQQARRLTLTVRFEQPIASERADENLISGCLEATMNGTVSGIEGVRWYCALGRRRQPQGVSIKTRLEAPFELSLASIRYQDVRIAPDPRTKADGNGYVGEFNVIPNADTVSDLTNAMSKQGYYLKHVIENPPRSGGRADHVQRVWEIAGRRYVGVYPIDFHLVLTGEEIHRGDVRPERGTMKIRAVVSGAYTDDAMRNRVDSEWTVLRNLLRETLGRPRTDEREQMTADPGLRGRGHLNGEAHPEAAPPHPPPDGSSRLGLLGRLGKLDEALLDGRITRDEYAEMRGRAEREFADG